MFYIVKNHLNEDWPWVMHVDGNDELGDLLPDEFDDILDGPYSHEDTATVIAANWNHFKDE